MKKIILLALGLGFFNTSFAQCGGYWGTTRYGGSGSGAGSVFVVDEYGQNPQIIHSFEFDFPGSEPKDQTLVEYNGIIYGTTTEGGTYDQGVLYAYNLATEEYTVAVHFKEEVTGSEPSGALMVSPTGIIYGTTQFSGPSGDDGVLFAYDTVTDSLEILLEFMNTPISGFRTTIFLANDGNIYGTSPFAGANSRGLLFQIDLNSLAYTTIYEFNDDVLQDGFRPQNQLIEGTPGILYGTTYQGGLNDNGVLFQYDYLNSSFTKLVDFESATSGSIGEGRLLLGSNNLIYGVNYAGGTNNAGTIFEYDPVAEVLVVLHNFEQTEGRSPESGLTETTNGVFYGNTYSGGNNGDGVVYEYNLNTNTYTKKFDFDRDIEGNDAEGELLYASNGMLYAALSDGSPGNFGSVYEYAPGDTSVNLIATFVTAENGHDIFEPLTLTSDGKLFSVANDGGPSDGGVLYEIDLTDSSFVLRHQFVDELGGQSPWGQLVEANGLLYGVTTSGGNHNDGVLFSFDPATDVFTVEHHFDETVDGDSPRNCLTLTQAGTLLGATFSGGANDDGILFEYDPMTSTLTVLFDLDEGLTGSNITRGFYESSPGVFYGHCSSGGATFDGTVFKYEQATNTFTVIHDFAGSPSDGSSPSGRLTLGPDGLLYGTCEGGGENGGTFFTVDITTDTYTKIKDFPGAPEAANPGGLFVFGEDGNIYGSTEGGGSEFVGTLFYYDLINDTIVTTLDEPISYQRPNGGYIFVPDLEEPTLTANLSLVPGSLIPCGKGDYEVDVVAADNCGEPTVLNVIEVPALTNPTVLYKVRTTNALKYRLDQNAVKVFGPDPQGFWNQVQADGGIAVEDGQIITYREGDVSSTPVVYNFDGSNALSLVKNASMKMVSTATDSTGNTTTVNAEAFIPCNASPGTPQALVLDSETPSGPFNIYPNPTNGTTQLDFSLAKSQWVQCQVFDLNGQVAQVLFAGFLEKGSQQIIWEANRLPAGMYLVQLQTEGDLQMQKIQISH